MTNVEKLLEKMRNLRESDEYYDYNQYIRVNAEKYERIIAVAVEALKEVKRIAEMDNNNHGTTDSMNFEYEARLALQEIEKIAGEK